MPFGEEILSYGEVHTSNGTVTIDLSGTAAIDTETFERILHSCVASFSASEVFTVKTSEHEPEVLEPSESLDEFISEFTVLKDSGEEDSKCLLED